LPFRTPNTHHSSSPQTRQADSIVHAVQLTRDFPEKFFTSITVDHEPATHLTNVCVKLIRYI